jgi:uncharacterized protein
MEHVALRPTKAPIEVREADGKGRGVFALELIKRGAVLEVVPTLLLSRESYSTYGQYTELSHYTFCWPGGRQAVALGLSGSMYNHRCPPNVGFVRNIAAETITFSAVSDILPGEECCIDYGKHLWFVDVGSAPAAGLESSSDDDDADAGVAGGEGVDNTSRWSRQQAWFHSGFNVD